MGDFKGDTGSVDTVLAAGPDVFAHNLETVPRLSRQVRVQASYARSYAILRHAKARGAITKTGLMLGLGEELDEVRAVLRELREIGVDILTLGQYLRPSRKHLAVARFVHPDEFAALKAEALAMGFPHVESGPMVRSSYHADGQRDIVRALRESSRRARPPVISLLRRAPVRHPDLRDRRCRSTCSASSSRSGVILGDRIVVSAGRRSAGSRTKDVKFLNARIVIVGFIVAHLGLGDLLLPRAHQGEPAHPPQLLGGPVVVRRLPGRAARVPLLHAQGEDPRPALRRRRRARPGRRLDLRPHGLLHGARPPGPAHDVLPGRALPRRARATTSASTSCCSRSS